MIALWASLAWSAPVGCDAPTERRTFDAALARAELAMSELDAAQLRDAVAAADQAFACLDEALGPPDVARWFRLAGFSRAVDGELAGGHKAAIRRREKGRRRPDFRRFGHALQRSHRGELF